jgi:hypothetical protein
MIDNFAFFIELYCCFLIFSVLTFLLFSLMIFFLSFVYPSSTQLSQNGQHLEEIFLKSHDGPAEGYLPILLSKCIALPVKSLLRSFLSPVVVSVGFLNIKKA